MGNLDVVAPPTTPIEERFAASYRVDRRSGCWRWTRSLRPNGYSQFKYSRAKNGYGHRFAYEHFVGQVPEGHTLHHTCRHRDCVNPEHLVALPPREHLMQDDTTARRNAEKTHCKRGHELAGENLRMSVDGKRVCRTCARLWREQHRDERRAYARAYYLKHRRPGAPMRRRRAETKSPRPSIDV